MIPPLEGEGRRGIFEISPLLIIPQRGKFINMKKEMRDSSHKFSKVKSKGFTLMELMVVITLIGIVASMIGPGFLDFYKRKNIKDSVQTLTTTFSKGFSSARSKALIFGAEGKKEEGEIIFFECDFPSCTTKTNFQSEELEKNVKIKSDDFEIRFFPPHGDIGYFSENGLENTIDDDFEIRLENKYARKIKIYKKSGLIETLQ